MPSHSEINVAKAFAKTFTYIGCIFICSLCIWFISTFQLNEIFPAFIYSNGTIQSSANVTISNIKDANATYQKFVNSEAKLDNYGTNKNIQSTKPSSIKMTMTNMKDPKNATYNESVYSGIKIDNYGIYKDIHSRKHEFDLAFVHIPKTGGTTIEYLMHNKFNISLGWVVGNKIFAQTKKLREHSQCKISQWHFPMNRLYKYMKDNNYTNLSKISEYYGSATDFFAIVRNPYTRYLSQYRYAVSGNFNNDIWMKEWTQKHDTNRHFKYQGSREKIRKLLCTVEHLNLFTSLFISDLDGYICIKDGHFIPQHDYIYDYDGNQRVKYVLRNENLTDEFIALLKGYSNTDSITRLDFDKNHDNFTHKCDLEVTDLNETNKLLIQEFYRMDFDAFGYHI